MHTVLQLQLRSLMCLLTAWACEHDDCMNVMWWLHECDDCIKAVKAYTSSHWSPYWYALCIKLAIQYIKTEISPDQHYKHLVARWVICLFHIDHHFRLFKALAARTFQPHFNLSLHRLPHTILLIESFNPIIFTYLSPSLTRSRVVAKSWNFVRQHQQNRTWPNYPRSPLSSPRSSWASTHCHRWQVTAAPWQAPTGAYYFPLTPLSRTAIVKLSLSWFLRDDRLNRSIPAPRWG